MRIDKVINNKVINNKVADNKESNLSLVVDKQSRDKPNESGSLNEFRETIKDILEEITSLEINTMIVDKIRMTKFDVKEFYLQLTETITYKTENGLQGIKDALIERSAQLKQKGLSLPHQTATPLLPKEALVIEEYRAELTSYNQELENYKEYERGFSDRKNSLDQAEKKKFDLEQACYDQLARQLSKMNLKKDDSGQLIADAQIIRCLRKAWEFEQSVLNGDRIYAQTKFQLDGDLTNRFIADLFMSSKSKIDIKASQLVYDLHRQGVENAERQWSGLILTCVNLVKDLIPFRAK